MKKLLIAAILLSLTALTASAGTPAPVVRLETSQGNITLELNRTKAPRTVANFLAYVKSGFYDNTIFHRVIKGFMIQGGGLDKQMQRKPTLKAIENEADNGLQNKTGTIAMARTGDPHSATSQFFINTVDNHFLDHQGKSPRGWGYCVFGSVTDGFNVLHNIENSRTTVRAGRRDVPSTPVVIRKAIVVSE